VQLSERVHLFFNKAGLIATKPAFKPVRGSKKNKGEAAAA
jgi:hypothetical protein